MSRYSLLLLAGSLIACSSAHGQEVGAPETVAPRSEKEWYYGPTNGQAEQKPLGRQRAEHRARQRSARLDSMRWYGFSANRPTASGLPFTTMYSPAWTRPGGRPFAWYTSQRPVMVVSPYYPSFY